MLDASTGYKAPYLKPNIYHLTPVRWSPFFPLPLLRQLADSGDKDIHICLHSFLLRFIFQCPYLSG